MARPFTDGNGGYRRLRGFASLGATWDGGGRCRFALAFELRKNFIADIVEGGAWYDLGVTLSRLKQRKKARACFLKTLRLDPKYAWAYYDLACLDALEEKPKAAFENLEKAVARGFRDIQHLCRDADLRSLRRDPRWKAIVARINELAKSD